MRSEFLKRCRELAEKNLDPKTVYNSPAYHKLLGYAEQLENEQLPEELFDGFNVFNNIDPKIKHRNTEHNVSDVLDAVVRMIRKRLARG